MTRTTVVRLMNEGVNVCFFNSVLQLLYSIPEFHIFLSSTPLTNHVIQELKNLFHKMDMNDVVQTSSSVGMIGLRDYNFRSQYDAEECLNFILGNCYPSPSDSIFHLSIQQSIWCERVAGSEADSTGCDNRVDQTEHAQILNLVPGEHQHLSIEFLLQDYFKPK